MNFSINKDLLLNNLLVAQKALSSKTPNPALQGIYMEAKNNVLTIITSNSDISIKLEIKDPSLNIELEGEGLIPGRYFIDIVRKLNSETISLSIIEDNILRILVDRSDITLNMMDINDYPNLKFELKDKPIVFDAKNLKAIIKQTTFATSTVENRPILTGVNLKVKENKLIAVSTDSFRLSQKQIIIPEDFGNINIIVPGKSLDELLKVIENENENVELHLDNNKVLFKLGNVLFQSRLLEGNYPETSRLIPSEFPIVLQFNKEDLISRIERAALLSNKEGNNSIVKLLLKPSGVVEISSNYPEIGKVLEEIYPLENVTGASLKIAFSSKYFLDALKTFTSEEVSVKFTGEIRPFIMETAQDEGLVELILPVRTE